MFLCGVCSRKNNLSLGDRLKMSEKIKYGRNSCTQCNQVVEGKSIQFKQVVKRKVKLVPRENGTVQIGLFTGFNSFNY